MSVPITDVDYVVSKGSFGKSKVISWIEVAYDEYADADGDSKFETADGRLLRAKSQIIKDIRIRLKVEHGGEFKRKKKGSDDWVILTDREAKQQIAYGFANVKKQREKEAKIRAEQEDSANQDDQNIAPADEAPPMNNLSLSVTSSQLTDLASDPEYIMQAWSKMSISKDDASSQTLQEETMGTFSCMSSTVLEVDEQSPTSPLESHQMLLPISEIQAAASEVSDDIHSKVEALNDNLDDEDFVERMMYFLADQTASIEKEMLMIAAGDLEASGIEILVKATHRYPHNHEIQGNAVWALSNLADYDDNRYVLIQSGGKQLIEKLAMGLAAFQSQSATNRPAWSTTNVASDVVKRMHMTKRVENLVQVMTASADNEQQQTYCCRVVGNLAVNFAYGDPIAKAEGIDLVLAAMRRFPLLAELQRQACRALGFLALRSEFNAKIMYLSGAVELIIAAMKRFPEEGSVLCFASPALESIGSAALGARERIEDLGGVELARDAWKDDDIFTEHEKMFWEILFPGTMVTTRFIFTDEFLQENGTKSSSDSM